MALWRETGKAGLALCARLAARSGLRASVASSQQHQQRDFVKLPDLSQAANAIGTFLDGKVMEAKYIHPYMFKQAEFVGEDYNGNKYYEIKKGVLYGRHRWFVPPDIFEYSPASVPPEWHGWLHNINNDAPSRVKFIEPSYKTEATTYKYLGYQPKGSYRKKLEFGRKRNWKKYQAWTPPSA
ncbi:NADH ubiquinone oxidoreductase subunit NDUFA12 [Chloropicon roscoffensis]|uniref:NADH dehydrogenase [ubiquinone] 1 alpha subcomplex subunit 12 n=2 Tax=Chloropicon roscoffensis TaxID=1461544 RepID=A0AAX4P2F6_9CHLO